MKTLERYYNLQKISKKFFNAHAQKDKLLKQLADLLPTLETIDKQITLKKSEIKTFNTDIKKNQMFVKKVSKPNQQIGKKTLQKRSEIDRSEIKTLNTQLKILFRKKNTIETQILKLKDKILSISDSMNLLNRDLEKA